MQPKIFNQTRLLANLMTKGVSKSLTRSDRLTPLRPKKDETKQEIKQQTEAEPPT